MWLWPVSESRVTWWSLMFGAGLLQMVEGLSDVGGVPGDDGFGDEGGAFTLDILVVGLAASDFALVGEKDEPPKGVE